MIVRLQVLAALRMKLTVFWDDVPRSLVYIYRRFKDTASIIRPFALMMEAVSICETSINFCEPTRCIISEDSYSCLAIVYDYLNT